MFHFTCLFRLQNAFCCVFCLVLFAFTFVLGAPSKKIALDFVETPLQDVVRALSLTYNASILVDDNLSDRVTFHLENQSLLEGLSALCQANQLEIYQDGSVFHIRKKVIRGEHEFSMKDSLVTVSVKNKDVVEFVREYGLNSGLNILIAPDVQGIVNGDLRNMPAADAFTTLMIAAGFSVTRFKGAFYVQRKELKIANSKEEKFRLERDGQVFSLEANDVPLEMILRKLANEAELNLNLYGEVRESVRAKLDNLDLENLLEILFKGTRYGFELDSNNLLVSERGARKALALTKLYPLKHIHSEKALNYLAKFSPSADFMAVEIKEQNALLLWGSSAEISQVENLLQQIDVPALQVTLSCVIVEFKRGKNFEIGLHGGSSRKTGEYNIGARGFLDFLEKDFSVSGGFGKIGLLPDRFELELSAMEERNEAEVLARPRLTTVNGNKAELNVTNTVYYLVSQVSAEGYPITDYRSFNDGISLELTPMVTQNGDITLDVSPEIKSAGRSSGDGPRDISTRNLKTVVLLKEGETLCLGGLIRKNKSEVRSAVPFLGSIPVIGRLFSYVSEVEEENELAIFITPHIEMQDRK